MQVELDRCAFRPGVIDGIMGPKTEQALRAWKQTHPDAELTPTVPTLTRYTVVADDLEGLAPVPEGWRGKAAARSLGYATVQEKIAERFHASEGLLERLNPGVNWANVKPGTALSVPNVGAKVESGAGHVEILLAERLIQVFDSDGKLVAQFPCSIAAKEEKKPVGKLTVTTIVKDPIFIFNPEVFVEIADIKEKLVIPAGPNNPVGTRWIGLSRQGYGIHGTPEPRMVGKTGSHGCFRMANWDVELLAELVTIGTEVIVK
jgi:lipoprotein-anchoring transpeptidase ErfK/SrfK